MSSQWGVGSHCLAPYGGKEWPVVLCDDDTPPIAFIERKTNPHLIPAILLGKFIFIWVREKDLREYDPTRDYTRGLPSFEIDEPLPTDTTHVQEEKLRRHALKVDALAYEKPEFWKNYIESRSAARKEENEERAKRKREEDEVSALSKKRRSNGESRRTTQRGGRLGTGSLLTPELTPRKNGVGSSVMKSMEIQDISDDDSGFVRNSRRFSDPFQYSDHKHSDDDDDEVENPRLEKIREKNLQQVRDDLPAIDHCTVFVGTEYTPFTTSRVAIGKCDFLSSHETYTEELGSHINLYDLTDIQADRFRPIGEYLKRIDFEPLFAKAIVTDRFENTIFLPDQAATAAQQIALTYHTAAKIRFENVQKICLRKLRLLDMLTPNALLLIAAIVHKADKNSFEVEAMVREWLAEQMAKQFWKTVQSEYMTLSRVMREDVQLSKRVFEKLAENPAMGGEGLDEDDE